MTKGVAPMKPHRRHVLAEVEIQILIERRVDGVGRDGDQQRVAVRRRLGGHFGGDIARGARPIVDDELLAEVLGQPLAHQPPGDVGPDAGREADDDAHRPRRIVERPRRAWHDRQRGGTGCETQKLTARKFHRLSPPEAVSTARPQPYFDNVSKPSMRLQPAKSSQTAKG